MTHRFARGSRGETRAPGLPMDPWPPRAPGVRSRAARADLAPAREPHERSRGRLKHPSAQVSECALTPSSPEVGEMAPDGVVRPVGQSALVSMKIGICRSVLAW